MANQALADIKAKLKQELSTLKNSVPPVSGNTISTKGKVFTFPDGKSSPGPIQMVILDHRNVNRYYAGAYNPQEVHPPVCWAVSKTIEDLAPSDAVAEKQAESCAVCPMNEWGSATNGGRGKACRNGIRLLLAAPDATEESEAYTLMLAPTSLRSFTYLVTGLEARGLLPIQTIVEASFDEASAYPVVNLKATAPVENLETMWFLREKFQSLVDAGWEAEPK